MKRISAEHQLIMASAEFIEAKKLVDRCWEEINSASFHKRCAEDEFEDDPKPFLKAQQRLNRAYDELNSMSLKKQISWGRLLDAKEAYDQDQKDKKKLSSKPV